MSNKALVLFVALLLVNEVPNIKAVPRKVDPQQLYGKYCGASNACQGGGGRLDIF